MGCGVDTPVDCDERLDLQTPAEGENKNLKSNRMNKGNQITVERSLPIDGDARQADVVIANAA